MTIRTLAFCLVSVSVTLGVVLSARSEQCPGQDPEVEARSSAVADLASKGVSGAPTGGAPRDGAFRIAGGDVEYWQNAERIGIDHPGSDGELVRRDLLIGGTVRASEFFEGGKLRQRYAVAADGSLLCTYGPEPIFPPVWPGGVY